MTKIHQVPLRTRAPRARARALLASVPALLMAVLAFAPAGVSVGADDLPELGGGSSAFISPAAEREVGRVALMQIRATMPIVDDPILKYYMHRHVFHLAEHSELSDTMLTPVLVDGRDLNAFAVPGGIIGLNLGLFLHARDVHEYSSVVAHELAHLSQRHHARDIEQRQNLGAKSLVGVVASIALGAAFGTDAGFGALAGSQALARDSTLRFSRAREIEADRIGLNTLVAAGYDPHGMARMFERMQQSTRFSPVPPEFLLTHPLSTSRITDARNQAATFDRVKPEPSEEYQMMRARALIHFAENSQRAVQEAEAREDGGDVDWYARAVAYSRNGQHEQALELARPLHEARRDSILMIGSYCEILIAAGRIDEADALLSKALVIAPDNPLLMMLHARALNAAERHIDASRVLRDLTRMEPANVRAWGRLAETAGLSGDTVGVYRARAEYFALHGAFNQAIQQLEYALADIPESNEWLRAGVAQRILDLRADWEHLAGRND